MFCENCGNRLEEGSVFCTNCGSRVDGAAPVAAPAAAPAAKKLNLKLNKKTLLIGAVALVAVVALVLILVLGGGRTAEGTVEQFMNAMVKGDFSKAVDLLPEEALEYLAEEEGYDKDEIKDMINDMEDEMKDAMEEMEDYMGDFKITYEIKDQDELSRSELKDLKEEYEELDIEISEAIAFEVEMVIETEDFGEQEQEMEIIVIKVGKNWYIDLGSMMSAM